MSKYEFDPNLGPKKQSVKADFQLHPLPLAVAFVVLLLITIHFNGL